MKNDVIHHRIHHSRDDASRDNFAFLEGILEPPVTAPESRLSQAYAVRATVEELLTLCPQDPGQLTREARQLAIPPRREISYYRLLLLER